MSLWAAWLAFRKRRVADNRRLLKLLALGTPMGFIAVEAGWMVTEVGRQPWVIQGGSAPPTRSRPCPAS